MPRLLVTGVGGASGFAVARLAKDLGIDTVWGDCDPYTPALLLNAEAAVVLPPARADLFLDQFEEVCRRHGITHMSPNVDIEIMRLGSPAAAGLRQRIRTWIPSTEVISHCQDKKAFSHFLSTYAPDCAPRCYASTAELADDFPRAGVVVKPRTGSGSKAVAHCHTIADVEAALWRSPGSVIQEFLDGDEFSADCLSEPGVAPLVHLRRRVRTRTGMSIVTESFADTAVEGRVSSLLQDLRVAGPSCVQGFMTSAGLRFTEVNVRFGGGCALSQYSGGRLVETYLTSLITGAPYAATDYSYRPGARLVRGLDFSYIPPRSS